MDDVKEATSRAETAVSIGVAWAMFMNLLLATRLSIHTACRDLAEAVVSMVCQIL